MCQLKGSKCCKEIEGEANEKCWCILKSNELKKDDLPTYTEDRK